MSKQKQPKRKVSFKDIPSHSISGFFGGINPNEGNISFFQDNLIPREGEHPGQIVLDTVEHKFMLNIRMAPAVWKRMADHEDMHSNGPRIGTFYGLVTINKLSEDIMLVSLP